MARISRFDCLAGERNSTRLTRFIYSGRSTVTVREANSPGVRVLLLVPQLFVPPLLRVEVWRDCVGEAGIVFCDVGWCWVFSRRRGWAKRIWVKAAGIGVEEMRALV